MPLPVFFVMNLILSIILFFKKFKFQSVYNYENRYTDYS